MRGRHPVLPPGFLLGVFVLLCAPLSGAAVPRAGTIINAQATATYLDPSNTLHAVSSELVVTILQQIADVTVSSTGEKRASPGSHVTYAHTLTNTGNGPDTFTLSSSNSGDFSLNSVTFYGDVNGDGVADNTTPITATSLLEPEGTFNFVVAGTAPSSATSGSRNDLTVTATSTHLGTVAATRVDRTTMSANAVLEIIKSIDVSSGPPSGTRTYTLTYINNGNAPASHIVLTDVIPSGMTYVPGSGRWSGTGATPLTDAGLDPQSGITYDFAETAGNRVTATIAGPVATGAAGNLKFGVTFKPTVVPGTSQTTNTASFWYDDGGGVTTNSTSTNSVAYDVAQTAALTYTGGTAGNATAGSTITFTNPLTNTGSGTDLFNIHMGPSSFPAGTTVVLYQSDGVSPLVDTNGDGSPDTGPMSAGARHDIVIKVTLPANASGGPFTLQSVATSRLNSSVSATATNTLNAIGTSTVDLTMNSAGVSAPGAGQGPGNTPVVANRTAPGARARFVLFVANAAGTATSFNLEASTNPAFSTPPLPAGWTVTFYDENEVAITSTGDIAAGDHRRVFADISVPPGTMPTTIPLWFRVYSPASGMWDAILDTLTVDPTRGITLTPAGNTGVIAPNGAAVYVHTLTNTGTVLEGDGSGSTGALSLSDSTSGFTSAVHWDHNNNEVLDASDPVITNLAELSGGTNGASTTAGLDPGESVRLFVKVVAPAGATIGLSNTTTLTLTMSGVVSGLAVPAPLVVTETSTVAVGQVTFVKMQAMDRDCDGVPEGTYTTDLINAGTSPGSCIRYQITATNHGTAPISNAVITDVTPPETIYTTVGPATATVGTVEAPADKAAGTVRVVIGTLAPNESCVLTFGVRISL